MDGFFSYVKATVAHVGDELKQQAALLQDESLGITYIGKQLLACGFPYDDSAKVGGATVALPVSAQQAATGVSVRQLATFLHRNHADKFMVWNLSEKSYDYSLLDNQVISFNFPGYPAPPLSQVFSLCNSIQAWLHADPANVAVLHCQTGHGRTICALTWYLAWSGHVATAQAALQHVTGKMGVLESILIPTQQRYMSYLNSMLLGHRPSAKPLLLERVIMSGIPALGDKVPGSSGSQQEEACRPYLQIFKEARLIYTSTGRDSTSLRWYTANDACVLFPVGLELEGDILVRIRHLSSDSKRVSMLRFGFHTGFVSPGNTRFTKAQLDGAYLDRRFPKNFLVDLVFREAAEPDASSEEGKKKLDEIKAREEWWAQVNTARRQTKGDLSTPPKQETDAAAAAASPSAAVSSAAAASSPSASSAASSLQTPPKSKPSLGSLFTSATNKLSLSLWGAADSLASLGAEESEHHNAAGLDLSNPEVARLHAADEAALKRARRQAATEAAVQAALQLSPGASSGQVNSARAPKQPAGADPDSFADLQAYVQGLGALDAQQLEVDSGDDESAAASSASPARSAARERQDALDLDKAMAQHFDEDARASPGDTPAAPADLDILGLNTAPAATSAAPTAAAPSSASASTPLSAAAAAAAADDASLEAELAMLSTGDDVVLDDADEAALLASLQDEIEEK